jgi:hypothetical protein
MLGNFKDIITRLQKQKTAIDRALAALGEFVEGDAAVPATPVKGVAKWAGKKRQAAKKKALNKLASAV